jgi:biopolymer transport protein ExbB
VEPNETTAPAWQPALEMIEAGGPVVLVLAACSVVAAAIVLLKLWQFRRLRGGHAAEALRLYRQGAVGEALDLADRGRDPASLVLARALRGIRRGLPEARVREAVQGFALALLDDMRGGLRLLEVIAGLAPLLGLFGTVLGMIEAFQQLEQAGNQVNPAILSGGIWEALLTTAVGLAVAIPAVALLNLLERVVERTALSLEGIVTQVFAGDLDGDVVEGTAHAPGWLAPAAAGD